MLLGLDLGTGGVRAVVVDRDGAVVGEGQASHPTMAPHPQWAEQDPSAWWRAARRAARQALRGRSEVRAIGLSGQMCTTVLVDEAGRALRPAIVWNDERCAGQAARMDGRPEITGNRALPAFVAPKLQWLRENEPGVVERAFRVLVPKDWLRHRLTGEFATDLSDASSYLLLDARTGAWSPDLVSRSGLAPGQLPAVGPSGRVTGGLTREAARALGLPPGLPVAAGAGDSLCAALASGAVEAGEVALSLGTSGIVLAPSSRFVWHPEGRVCVQCHARAGLWGLMGVLLSAGACLQWLASVLGRVPFARLSAEAEAVPAGAEGLAFLPYLSGASTPRVEPWLRAGFVGLTPSHGRGHLVRAVMEGVAFAFRDCLDAFGEMGVGLSRVTMTGGGARSALWRRILADVLQVPVAPLQAVQGPAFGAAMTAAVALGDFGSLEEACSSWVRRGEAAEPGRCPEDLLARQRDLLERLEPWFAQSRPNAG